MTEGGVGGAVGGASDIRHGDAAVSFFNVGESNCSFNAALWLARHADRGAAPAAPGRATQAVRDTRAVGTRRKERRVSDLCQCSSSESAASGNHAVIKFRTQKT